MLALIASSLHLSLKNAVRESEGPDDTSLSLWKTLTRILLKANLS